MQNYISTSWYIYASKDVGAHMYGFGVCVCSESYILMSIIGVYTSESLHRLYYGVDESESLLHTMYSSVAQCEITIIFWLTLIGKMFTTYSDLKKKASITRRK